METWNILLVALSTFPKKIQENTYCYEKDNEKQTIKGRAQQEAGIKYFLRQEKIDEIVLVETWEVKHKPYKAEDKENTSEKNMEGKTVAEYLKEQIAAEEEYKDFVWKEIEIQETENEKIYHPEKVIKHILDRKKRYEEVNIYRDSTGAPRDLSFVIDVSLKVLDLYGIKLRQTVLIDFKSRVPETTIHPIKDITDNDRYFNLISGMKAFKKYGYADELKEYQRSALNLEGADEEIIDKMIEIADAIGICQIDKFIKSAGELLSEIDEIEDEQSKKYVEDYMFRECVDLIKDDYKQILKKNEDNHYVPKDIIEIVKWCSEKQWYQQALTIIESKMPEEIWRHIGKMDNIFEKKFLDHCKENRKDWENEYQTPFKYSHKEWSYEKWLKDMDENKTNQIKTMFDKHIEMKNYRNHVNHAKENTDKATEEPVNKKIADYVDTYEKFVKEAKEWNQ